MNINEQIKNIDDFFKNLSIDEFERIAIDAGINESKSSSDYGMELLLDSNNVAYTKDNSSYSKDSNYISVEENDFDLFSIDYGKAV